LIDAVIQEKGQLIKKAGILNFVTTIPTLDEIGGLDNLKDWLKKRGRILSDDGQTFGLQIPKGVLITGLSGCGKSLCAKVFASFWGIPLLHLDMARLYDGTVGEPEKALQVALQTAETVSPAVLWIDEIEAGISVQSQKAEGNPVSSLRLFPDVDARKEGVCLYRGHCQRHRASTSRGIEKGTFRPDLFCDPSKRSGEEGHFRDSFEKE